MENSIIECDHLNRFYENRYARVTAVHELCFSVNQGEFVAVVGRSGSGKSTLLNLIGGLDSPSSGSIRVLGKELGKMKSQELARHRRHAVGMIFQSFNLIPSRTALENVELALLFGGTPKGERRKLAASALDSMGLKDRMRHRPGELSGGEQQRVAIARALVNKPAILLADEPTGNLDSVTAEKILDLLAGLNRQGLTVLMVTHDADSVKKVSGRTLRLLDGRLVEDTRRSQA
ncbi:ABC transporter ATP-binding protein [bacterium]|nr:ABC transporter ATP-binding protein [bacterium]